MDFHSMLGKLRAIESLGTTGLDQELHEEAKCNMTEEGDSCPVHGLEECPVTVSVPMSEDSDDQIEEAKKKKPDADGDGVPDWADKKPGKDDNDETEESVEETIDAGNPHASSLDELMQKYSTSSDNGLDEEFDGTATDVLKMVASGDKNAFDVMNHPDDRAEEEAAHILRAKYDEAASENHLHPDDDHEEIMDHVVSELAIEYAADTIDEDDGMLDIPLSRLGGGHNGPDSYGYSDIRESLNIVANTVMQDGKVTKSLSVTASDEAAESLAALLRNAGMVGGYHDHDAAAQIVPAQVMHAPEATCSGCGMPEDQCGCDHEAAMENADHDHGHDHKHSTGEPVDAEDYTWEGPHTNQRFGKIGDNTLMQERAASLFSSLTEQYRAMLEEADLAASNAGSMSPLSATKRDKFEKDPNAGEEPVTDGSMSPMSKIKRQSVDN